MTQTIKAAWLNHHHGLFALSAFLVFAGFVDAYHAKNSKSYIKNTAIWVQKNLSPDSLIATGDEFISYRTTTLLFINREVSKTLSALMI